MGIIISAFPGMGKTYSYRNLTKVAGQEELKILDSDSSEFSWIVSENGKIRNPDFPQNYIEHIKNNVDTCDIIFVSSHKEVRKLLSDNKMISILVYPNPCDKEKFIQRYKNRDTGRNDDAFVNLLSDKWDTFMRDLSEVYPYEIHYIESDYLNIHKILKTITGNIISILNSLNNSLMRNMKISKYTYTSIDNELAGKYINFSNECSRLFLVFNNEKTLENEEAEKESIT